MSGRHIVTGGSGFVGQRLVAALRARGERVIVFDTVAPAAGEVEHVVGDVTRDADLARLALGPDDVVHHLAARQFMGDVPRRNRDAWFAAVNVEGTRRLLSAMAVGGTRRLIFFSTDMTYGLPRITPLPPTCAQFPIGPYGRSKLAAERLIHAAGAEFALRATIFRPRLIAGAGRLGILATLFKLIARDLPVPMIGSGRNRYQMIAVSDCVAAALRAVEHDFPPRSFNLGSEDPPTVRALLGDLVARCGSRSRLVATPGPLVKAALATLDTVGLTLLYPEQYRIADADYILDTSETRRVLSWEPTRRDADIIFDAYSSFRQEGAAIRSPANAISVDAIG